MSAPERGTLDRLLTYGPQDNPDAADGELLLVVPRPGTISPWASKATDIAHSCGLDAIVRVERGIAYRASTHEGVPLADAELSLLRSKIHDRMTEAIFPTLEDARALFVHLRAATAIGDRPAGRWPHCDCPCQC